MECSQYKFIIQHLISSVTICSEEILFQSPLFPSTGKDEDFIEGELKINNKNKNITDEKIKNCLEASFSLSSGIYCPVDLKNISPGLLFTLESDITAHSTYHLENPEEIPLIWKKYFSIILDDNNEFHHAINWFMRSLKSNDPIERFIYAWITLNCLYGYLCNTAAHKNGIRGLIYNNIPATDVKEKIVMKNKTIFEYLASLSLIDRRNNKNWSEELQKSLSSNDVDGIIQNGISAIAIVRHTIFHGNVTDRKNEAERCIWPLIHLNAEILKNRLLRKR